MHRHRWVVSVCFALPLLAPLVGAVGRAEDITCPPAQLSIRRDELTYHLGGEHAVSASTYDSSFNVGDGFARLRFDHSRSTLASSIASNGWFTASVRVVESFDVTGVPPGTPVNATFEFSVDGWVQNCGLSGCGVSYWASLVAGADSAIADASQHGPGEVRTYLTGTLSLPVTLIAGSPAEATFAINYRTTRYAVHIQAEGAGTFSVSGLPPGVRAVRCREALPTPTQARSWGSIKRLDR